MTKLKYIAMPGGCLSGVQAEIVGKELDKIAKKHGAITPQGVVKSAESETSPIHPYFTWDDSEAAQMFREDQARKIIRSVRIVHLDIPHQEQPIIRAFLNVKASDTETRFQGQAYIPMIRIKESPDYEQQILNKAKDELRQWQIRYQDYRQYFESIVKEILEIET